MAIYTHFSDYVVNDDIKILKSLALLKLNAKQSNSSWFILSHIWLMIMACGSMGKSDVDCGTTMTDTVSESFYTDKTETQLWVISIHLNF